MTQSQLATQLGVNRRTIIRAEQRGLEAPWFSSTYKAWCDLQKFLHRSK